jgi:thiaminase
MQKRFVMVFFLTLAMVVPALAQYGGHGRRLSPQDQQRFDSYYSRWVQYKQTNNNDQVRSMEQRMDTLKAQYRIPPNVPYWQIATGGRQNEWQGGYHWRPMLSPSDQQKYDSYYSRWINYRNTHNMSQMASMQRRMDDLKARYNIGPEVPYDRIATPGTR